MRKDFYYLSNDQETKIHAAEWIPDKKPKAVLQIIHGMVEHIGRYAEFAEYLADAGFYVVGNDHLGHGESVTSDEKHGFFHAEHGNEYLIGDIHELRQRTSLVYPDIPYFMLGHSMGSFLLRQYITLYGEGLKGAVIMGTGSQPSVVLKAGRFLCRSIAAAKGPMYRSQTLDNVAFGSYNSKFQPSRTTHDWLTKDEQIVDKYLADLWCTFTFTVRAYDQMFYGIEYIQNKDHIAKIPKDLPLLVVSGAEDPVGDFGKGAYEAYQTYHDAGIKDIQIKLYPGDRHEILNETDRQQVYEDLRNWLEARI